MVEKWWGGLEREVQRDRYDSLTHSLTHPLNTSKWYDSLRLEREVQRDSYKSFKNTVKPVNIIRPGTCVYQKRNKVF